MKLTIVVSPDFGIERGIDWVLLGALLRKRQVDVNVLTPTTLAEYDVLLAGDTCDVVFANPVDALTLARDRGFIPFARPTRVLDEMLISCASTSSVRTIMDLRPRCRVALVADRCVEMVGMRLLEPANLPSSGPELLFCDSSAAVANLVVDGAADIGFFGAEPYSAMPLATRRSLRPLVKSDIGELSHMLLCNRRRVDEVASIQSAFVQLATIDEETASALRLLGLELGFSPLTPEAAEDTFDLVDVLLTPAQAA